ncbi:uncharacterized protein LOC135199628 [Macrobrachium nipponense]|uniref:uncharacterized protein LOC135199628 n=1 Tax=Macrobrachium nipponense TaxID=159736 RepID=UPI0030C7D845
MKIDVLGKLLAPVFYNSTKVSQVFYVVDSCNTNLCGKVGIYMARIDEGTRVIKVANVSAEKLLDNTLVDSRKPITGVLAKIHLKGMIPYYCKVVKNFSSKLAPLYDLLKKNVKFRWTSVQLQQRAFEGIKRDFAESKVLTSFDGDSPLIIEVDASPVGVGCVLLQKATNCQDPGCNAVLYDPCAHEECRTHAPCATTHNGMIVWHPEACTICYDLAAAVKEVALATLKAWVGGFGKNAAKGQPYILDKKLAIQIFPGGKATGYVDPISAVPLIASIQQEVQQAFGSVLTQEPVPDVANLDLNLEPMAVGVEDLLVEYDYELVHKPGKENVIADALSRLPLDDDFHSGHQLNSHSKFLDTIQFSSSTTSAGTIGHLRKTFCNFGIPDIIVSDNAPNFVSQEMEEFLHKNSIKHVTPTPYHPSSNGLAERAVRT